VKGTELSLDALALADAIDAHDGSVANVFRDVTQDLVVALDGRVVVGRRSNGAELPGAARRLSASVVRVRHGQRI